MRTSDTIVAVSSAPGRSPRGLLRCSGEDLAPVLTALLASPDPALPPRTLHRVRLRHPPLPALLTTFAGPASYTGQHIAELQVPGHPALLQRLLRRTLDAGVRLAEPGEFTFRAYLAGRIDLTQAEGIAATIAAVSDSQLEAASLLRQGRLGQLATALVDALGEALALTEAGIDFVDQEDVVAIAPADLDARLESIAAQLDALLTRSRPWGELEALPRVVLLGAPSAGKSTLFNALLGRQRAVIDAAPGTTRDVLIEPMILDGPNGQRIEIELVDLAGLDEPRAALDERIQHQAREALAKADLVVRVRDGTGDTEHLPLPEPLPEPAHILEAVAKADRVPPAQRDAEVHWVSAHTGENLDALRSAIASRLGDRGVSVMGDMLALQPRHEAALRAACDHLAAARALLAPQRDARHLADMELIAGEMRAALDAAAGLGGRLSPDDVLGRIFANFCVGK